METFGIFEKVSMPDLGIFDVVAKIDTGAYSGAIHCSSIKEVKRKSDGKMILKFKPIDKNSNEVQLEKYRVTRVKSSTGHITKRYLIKTNIIIKDKQYTVRIGLSDRSDMDKQILIGRKFLRKNEILVDVRINKQFEKNHKGEL